MKELERLQEFVDRMKSTSSLLEKKKIIKSIEDDSFITKVLYYTYNLLYYTENLLYYTKNLLLRELMKQHSSLFS